MPTISLRCRLRTFVCLGFVAAIAAYGVLSVDTEAVSHAAPATHSNLESTYNCTPVSCVGVDDWEYDTVVGGSTSFQVIKPSCNPVTTCANNYWYVSNYIKVMEDDPLGYYYVIVGDILPPIDNRTGFSYFWADWRPGDTGLNFHWFGYVPSADYGQLVTAQIRETGIGSDEYEASVWTGQGTNLGGYSTDNFMDPNYIEQGVELYANDPPITASDPEVQYVLNYWQGYNDQFHFQSSNGSLYSASPAYVDWITEPDNPLPVNGGTGGDLYTICGC